MSMDRKIEKKRRPLWQWTAIGLGAIALVFMLWRVIADASIRTYSVPFAQVVVSTVDYGAFEDVIPIRGTIQPFDSVFLDAVDGGVVEEIFVEEGSFVEAGQPLLQFSNSDLQLNVARNDTSITEQLNNLNNIRNQLETTQLNTERELIDTQYRMTNLQRRLPRMEQLVRDKLVSDEEYQAARDEHAYLEQLLANIRSRQQLEDRIRTERLKQIDVQMSQLEANLKLSQTSYENLLVRAPISGQLTSFTAEIGENKTRGTRLGQIDVVDRYKIAAQIDEFYVTRVSDGQVARFTLGGNEFRATVGKVYPEIREGTFNVDLVFDGDPPADIRRGQTLQLNLTLGTPVDSLLLPVGGFLQDTGGNWAFVLDAGGEFATKREMRTGRRNSRMIEVIEGLERGERVITSSYGAMVDMERIQLTGRDN
ncbi:MAG: efflux RND transporter periplasmic adaptor subunit [Gammaproteobacteria bacterium]